jgi:protein-S-isoprenylcysteine O-methyltransferase Ste14
MEQKVAVDEVASAAEQAKHEITASQKYRIRVSIFFALVGLVLIAISESYWREKVPLVGGLMFTLGLVLASIGGVGRIWCSVYVAGYKNKVLITEGPYSLTRNPLYFFSMIGAIGIGLATRTVTVPLVIGLVFGIYYPLVLKGESKILRSIHGQAYDDYCSRVPGFFPRFRNLIEPKTYTVRPKVIRRHMSSAIWFVWLVAIVEIFAYFRMEGVIPSVFNIF